MMVPVDWLPSLHGAAAVASTYLLVAVSGTDGICVLNVNVSVGGGGEG